MNCNHCGQPLPDDAAFCGFCGTAVTIDTQTPLADQKKKRSLLPIILIIASILLIAAMVGIGIVTFTLFGKDRTPTPDDTAPSIPLTSDVTITDDNIREVYDALKADNSPEAAEKLKNFIFVPTSETFELGSANLIYDNSGNYIKYDAFFPDGAPNFHYDYSYDDNGYLYKAVYTNYDSEYVVEYTYDENNHRVKEVTTYSVDRQETIDYTYDENGNLVKEVETNYNGDQDFTDYTYDENGNLVKEVETNHNGDQDFTDYYYDENGNLIKKICNDYIYEYTYENGRFLNLVCTDPEGHQTLKDYYYDNDDNLIGNSSFYYYDDDGNPVFSIGEESYTWELKYYENGIPPQILELCEQYNDPT